MSKGDIRRNASGYYDPTAYHAITKADAERERFHRLLDVIRGVCELSGFRLKEHIVVEDKRTGRIWR